MSSLHQTMQPRSPRSSKCQRRRSAFEVSFSKTVAAIGFPGMKEARISREQPMSYGSTQSRTRERRQRSDPPKAWGICVPSMPTGVRGSTS
jgi:hypothetical protein